MHGTHTVTTSFSKVFLHAIVIYKVNMEGIKQESEVAVFVLLHAFPGTRRVTSGLSLERMQV